MEPSSEQSSLEYLLLLLLDILLIPITTTLILIIITVHVVAFGLEGLNIEAGIAFGLVGHSDRRTLKHAGTT